jgi:hypothetical protein
VMRIGWMRRMLRAGLLVVPFKPTPSLNGLLDVVIVPLSFCNPHVFGRLRCCFSIPIYIIQRCLLFFLFFLFGKKARSLIVLPSCHVPPSIDRLVNFGSKIVTVDFPTPTYHVLMPPTVAYRTASVRAKVSAVNLG